ncbi:MULTISPECIES: hypothetical protein [unclassified Anaeromyxobacter]|uniref:hypothetical protein n=1 Tax=unclassified Anaeromyxobacter TaxID=2620896 RepID=UPI001F57E72C|nr:MULTISPECIES: hypothetical protein [unclassified Anaeromyxobacter]
MTGRAELLLAAALLATAEPAAGAEWGVQLLVGGPLNLRTPLTIRQRGEPDLHLRARWATRPFENPIYYGIGGFRREGGREISLEFLHHKIYLQNPPPEVQDFSVSHGFNLLVGSYGIEVARGVWTRLGGGLVLAHPESTVRGQALDEGRGLFGLGLHLAGPSLSAGIEGRLPLGTDRLRLTVGGRVVGAYAGVPIANGSARIPNVAFHATAGLDGVLVR